MMRLGLCAIGGLVWAGAALASPQDGLEAVRRAALAGDPAIAAPFLAEDMVLVSQSGTVYGRAEALQDLGNGFLSWENREVRLVGAGEVVRVTLINRRTRMGRDGKLVPATDYRVLQLWEKRGADWLLVAQSSTRMGK
jgi:ketosteroid isomerase-like protein